MSDTVIITVGVYLGWLMWGHKAKLFRQAQRGDVLCSFCLRPIPNYSDGGGCSCAEAQAAREEFVRRLPK